MPLCGSRCSVGSQLLANIGLGVYRIIRKTVLGQKQIVEPHVALGHSSIDVVILPLLRVVFWWVGGCERFFGVAVLIYSTMPC